MNVEYEITDAGLVFILNESDREELAELLEQEGQASLEYEIFCSSGFYWVAPEDIGALTSAPILADSPPDEEEFYSPDTQMYWFPDYQVESPLETLRDTGRVVFTKAL